MFVTIYLVLELFQTQISDQKDSFVHDVLQSSLFNGKSSSFPSVYFIAVKTRFSKANLSHFQWQETVIKLNLLDS